MNHVLGMLYPRRCPICGKILEEKKHSVCKSCRPKVQLIKSPFCLKCGKPLANPEKEYCGDCERYSHFFTEGRAAFPYTGSIKKSLLNMKLHNRRTYSNFFAGAMAAKFQRYEKEWNIDLICPIPLYKKKRRYRGFNQAELLAFPIGKMFQIPVVPDLLVKVQETSDQKELNRKSRQKNLKKAFKIGPYDVKLRRILLVDDVYTTGSTMDAAAAVLKEAGAAEIFFLTACIGTEKDAEENFSDC